VTGSQALLGIDIGTTKVAAVIGAREADLRISGAASVPCQGLRRGTVVDIAETTRAIREAVAKAQRSAGVELAAAWVGVTGQHMSCLNSRAEIQMARANREITWADVDRVMSASVSSVSIPPDRQMLHAVSRCFHADDGPRVRHPVGLTANRLGVETHIVTVPRNLVANLSKCIEQADLEVAELVAEPLATADAVLAEHEQALGILLIDIGGGTTDLALFLDGSICYTGAVPAAGSNVTHDLAVALGITHPQAEQIKLAHGSARVGPISEDETVPIPEDEDERAVSRRFVAEVIEARALEISELVRQEMGRLGAAWPPPGGAALTGGSSLLPGIASVCEDVLACRVRLARPQMASGPVGILESPALATGVGLVCYAHRELESRRTAPGLAGRLLGRLVTRVRGVFGA
jgi:cell division protein FtsA